MSPADTARLRQAQAGIRALVERDLRAFFGSLTLDRPEAARDALLEFVPLLVAQYGESAAAVAADWYDEVRAADRVPGRFHAVVVVPDESERAVETARRLSGALFTPSPGDALVGLVAAAPKFALAGSRQTIVRSTRSDPQARGWQRVVRADACDFCTRLHGRGAVYSADTANFEAHKSCNCAAAPVWAGN